MKSHATLPALVLILASGLGILALSGCRTAEDPYTRTAIPEATESPALDAVSGEDGQVDRPRDMPPTGTVE